MSLERYFLKLLSTLVCCQSQPIWEQIITNIRNNNRQRRSRIFISESQSNPRSLSSEAGAGVFPIHVGRQGYSYSRFELMILLRISTLWLDISVLQLCSCKIMDLPDSRRPPVGSSHIHHIKRFSSKFYYKRLLEVIICLVICKSIIYYVYWVFIANNEINLFKVLYEYVVSMLLVHNISCELFSEVDYKTTYVKYILGRSARMVLLFYDSYLVSEYFGLSCASNETRRTCLYFFPGKITERLFLPTSLIGIQMSLK